MTTAEIPPNLLASAREVCLGFPDATEQETWDTPTFRVRSKIFAILGWDDEAERCTLVMKAPPGEQEILVATGDPFFVPSYVGKSGWIGMYLNGATDWVEVAELLEDSYRMTATKAQIERLELGVC